MMRMEQKSGGYMEGWIAGENGDPRRCINPWNTYWLVDWYRGYDDAVAASRRSAVKE
jgi:hypothetical protein